MDHIATRAGVSLATAYTYFANKRDFIGPLYEPYFLDISEQLAIDLQKFSALESLERLVVNLCSLVKWKSSITTTVLAAAREQSVLKISSVELKESDITQTLPFSGLMAKALHRAQESSEIPRGLPIRDIGSYHTNALLLRLFIEPNESVEEMAQLVLSQLFPVLDADRSTRLAVAFPPAWQ
jgi:AcrR family transcriptional regulator